MGRGRAAEVGAPPRGGATGWATMAPNSTQEGSAGEARPRGCVRADHLWRTAGEAASHPRSKYATGGFRSFSLWRRRQNLRRGPDSEDALALQFCNDKMIVTRESGSVR